MALAAVVVAGCSTAQVAPASGSAAPAPTSAALVPTPSASASPGPAKGDRFGVAFSGNEGDPTLLRSLKVFGKDGIGVGWASVGFGQANLQLQSGTVDFTRPCMGAFAGQSDYVACDALVAGLGEQGFRIAGTIAYGSWWNTTAPPSVPVSARDRFMYPPKDYDAYASFIGTLVTRYRSTVRAWLFWAEPDLKQNWFGTTAEFARMLRVTHDAIKRADPTALVVLGGVVFGGPIDDPARAQFANVDFLPQILHDATYPAADSIDVMDVHLYHTWERGDPKVEFKQRVDYVRRELAKVGASRPLWVSEIGYASDPKIQRNAGYGAGQDSQAAWLRELLPYVLDDLGVQKVFWFTLVDTPKSGEQYATHGLLSADLTPKKSLEAYRTLIGSR